MHEPEMIAVFIPIISIVGGVAIAIVAIIMGARKKELHHKERLIAMERGIEIPTPPKEDRRPAYLHNRSAGLVMTLLGIALTIAMWVAGEAIAGVWGLLPLAVGIGLLISSALEQKDLARKSEEERRSGITSSAE